MYYAFANSLGRPYVSGLDADAKAYITAIVAAGATVTGAQKTAISDFVVAEKDASRWTGLKRFYLPVWGVAAANAICMKSLASGSFVGGVTHAAGYVQGNGTTGYFNSGTTPAGVGLSTGSCIIFDLLRNDVANTYHGAKDASNYTVLLGDTGTGIRGEIPSATSGTTAAATAATGIIVVSQTASNARAIYRRITSGFATASSSTTNDTSPLPALNPYFSGALNNLGTAALFNTNQSGLFGFGSGINATNAEAFTLNLKTLWETVTGLTIA